MRIPRFWAISQAQGKLPESDEIGTFTAVGWSFESLSGAEESARQRAIRIAERAGLGERRATYGYFDRPIREEIEETIAHDGDEHGVITRNQYGALVLNSSRVMFADVDFPAVIPRGFFDAMRLSFSRNARAARSREVEQATWNRVRAWAEANSHRSFRLYRTAAGMRLLLTDRVYEPAAADTTKLLEELGSDPLYRKLTQVQECFRARLTPKPWRCGVAHPPCRFPFIDREAEGKYRRWQSEYEKKSTPYRACELVGTFGTPAQDAIIEQTIRIHDDRACQPNGAPLA
jgi:hypothetical protein